MKKIFASLFLLLSLFSVSHSQVRNIDVVQYSFRIEVLDRSDSIYGKAGIRFILLTDSSSVSIDLRQRSGRVGFTVAGVTVGNRAVAFKQKNDQVITNLKGLAKKGSTVDMEITYSGIPADGLIISKNKFGKRTFFSDNWPNRAHEWIPCVDNPADKSPVEFTVISPDHYQVISNGVLVSRTALEPKRVISTWKEVVPLPTKIMVVGIAEFATQQSGVVDSIPVSTWVFPENRDKGFKVYSIAPSILRWLIDYIGPFSYKKLAHVQSRTIFGGMENAGAIFYDETMVDGHGEKNESLIAHETAHQFFGDMVTEKNFADLWLSEGFATYFSLLYLESKYGSDSVATALQADRERIIDYSHEKKTPVIDSSRAYMQLLGINSYEKGAWVLHMLRRSLGDSLFRKSIREYYRAYAGKNANTGDLRAIFEQVSGRSLDSFFHQWLFQTGQPDLQIRWRYNESSSNITIDIEQLQKADFTFPIEFMIGTIDHKKEIVRLDVTSRNQTFTLPVTSVPVELTADPNVSLLFSQKILHGQ